MTHHSIALAGVIAGVFAACSAMAQGGARSTSGSGSSYGTSQPATSSGTSPTGTSQGGTSELWGTARITFKIEILFLSFEVSAEVEKRFAGSGPSSRALPPAGGRAAVTSAMGGVKFAEIYSEPEWNEYCLAFA